MVKKYNLIHVPCVCWEEDDWDCAKPFSLCRPIWTKKKKRNKKSNSMLWLFVWLRKLKHIIIEKLHWDALLVQHYVLVSINCVVFVSRHFGVFPSSCGEFCVHQAWVMLPVFLDLEPHVSCFMASGMILLDQLASPQFWIAHLQHLR